MTGLRLLFISGEYHAPRHGDDHRVVNVAGGVGVERQVRASAGQILIVALRADHRTVIAAQPEQREVQLHALARTCRHQVGTEDGVHGHAAGGGFSVLRPGAAGSY